MDVDEDHNDYGEPKLNSYGKEADEPQFTEYVMLCYLCGKGDNLVIGSGGICGICYEKYTDENGEVI